MPKMRARCESPSAKRALALLFGLTLLLSSSTAFAAARRIALVHAEPELTRSVDLALYPWDIDVVVIDDTPPDATAPDAARFAQDIAARHKADAIAWIVRSRDSATLWFYDGTTHSLHSHPLPTGAQEDAAQFAAVALTLKTFVRGAPWEAHLPIVRRESSEASWETQVEIDALGRAPLGGVNGEPRFGIWAIEWYGRPAVSAGLALGASAGLGMTFDNAAARGSVQDVDVRGDARVRIRLARSFTLEPRVGASAHVERAQLTATAPAQSSTLTRVNPSLDGGLFFAWQATDAFSWSIGAEVLGSLRYQRWLVGQDAVFSPSPVWIQAGSAIAWRFR
jgi:hypothetical protein